MGVEVSQHVRHGVEPQVVDVALTVLIHRQTQMLTGRRQGEWGGGQESDRGVESWRVKGMKEK